MRPVGLFHPWDLKLGRLTRAGYTVTFLPAKLVNQDAPQQTRYPTSRCLKVFGLSMLLLLIILTGRDSRTTMQSMKVPFAVCRWVGYYDVLITRRPVLCRFNGAAFDALSWRFIADDK